MYGVLAMSWKLSTYGYFGEGLEKKKGSGAFCIQEPVSLPGVVRATCSVVGSPVL